MKITFLFFVAIHACGRSRTGRRKNQLISFAYFIITFIYILSYTLIISLKQYIFFVYLSINFVLKKVEPDQSDVTTTVNERRPTPIVATTSSLGTTLASQRWHIV